MTSCKNRQFLPPSLPSVIDRHYCLTPPPSEQKMMSSRPDLPSNFFNCFMHIIMLYISVSPSFNYYQCYGSEKDFRSFYPLWKPNPTYPMTVAALATSLRYIKFFYLLFKLELQSDHYYPRLCYPRTSLIRGF